MQCRILRFEAIAKYVNCLYIQFATKNQGQLIQLLGMLQDDCLKGLEILSGDSDCIARDSHLVMIEILLFAAISRYREGNLQLVKDTISTFGLGSF